MCSLLPGAGAFPLQFAPFWSSAATRCPGTVAANPSPVPPSPRLSASPPFTAPRPAVLAALVALAAGCTGTIGGESGAGGDRNGTDPCKDPAANQDGCDVIRQLGDEVPQFVPLRRLNRVEYGVILEELLGAPRNIGDAFEADGQTDGFDTVGQSLTISDGHARTHLRLVETAVAAALAGVKRPEIMICAEENADCARTIAAAFGRRAWRRDLEPGELDELIDGVYTPLRADTLSHGESVAALLESVLNAPEFFFRIELDSGYDGPRPLTSNEMATRLSLFFWSSIPDDELLALAATDELQNEDVLRAEVSRMLASDRARLFVENFAGQWLRTRELPGHSVSAQLFPEFTPAVRASAKRESEQMFWDILSGNDSVAEIILADWGYVDAALAPFYGVNQFNGFDARTTLGGERKLGLLGRVAFLTESAMFDRTSVVRRGNRILGDILCASPGPPNDAATVLPEPVPGEDKTLRERLEEHRNSPECSSCHNVIDPLGFALENFDAIGRVRTTYEDGVPVVTSGELPGYGPFEEGSEIGPAIASDPRYAQCVARKLMIYGVGRDYVSSDVATLERIAPDDGSAPPALRELMTRLVLSAAFRVRRDTP
jgi:hypothetical protein